MMDTFKDMCLLFEISGLVYHQVDDTIKKLELLRDTVCEDMKITHSYLKRNINTITCTVVTNDLNELTKLYKLLLQFPIPNPCKSEEYNVYSSTIHTRIELTTNIIKRK